MTWPSKEFVHPIVAAVCMFGMWASFLWLQGTPSLLAGICMLGLGVYEIAQWARKSRSWVLPVVGYFLWSAWLAFLAILSFVTGHTGKMVLSMASSAAILLVAISRVHQVYSSKEPASNVAR